MNRFRGQGASEKSKHVGTIIVLLAQLLPSCVTVNTEVLISLSSRHLIYIVVLATLGV
jgi:hypothetical protein